MNGALLALVGTISGSNGTSNTAVTGTLVIANTTVNFPTIPSDSVLFVSGVIGGSSKGVFGGDLVVSGNADIKGDLTGSNLRLTGDIAVLGGDLTSTSTSFNFVQNSNLVRVGSSTATLIVSGTVDVSGSSGNTVLKAVGGDISITSTTGRLNIGPASNLQIFHNNVNAAITNATGHLPLTNNALNQRIDLVTTGSTAAGMVRIRRLTGPTGAQIQTDLLEVRNDGTILIGSASTGPTGLGSTTISNDLFLSTGIIAVNTDATAIQLVSSGNVTIKLDANNNAPGHFFAIVDNAGGNEFVVNENGNADVTGNLVVTGSVLGTATTTTFNLLNTTLTGTLNVGGATQRMNFGGITSTGSFPGELLSDGNFNVGLVSERLLNSSSAGSSLNFDLGAQTIFYVNNPTADINANFTNVPITNLRVITPTIILSQSATPRNITAVRIENVTQGIKWAGGSSPTVTANRQEVFGFSLIRSGSIWSVLGQMTSYG